VCHLISTGLYYELDLKQNVCLQHAHSRQVNNLLAIHPSRLFQEYKIDLRLPLKNKRSRGCSLLTCSNTAPHKPHHHNPKTSPGSVDSSNAIPITEYSDKENKSITKQRSRITHIKTEVNLLTPNDNYSGRTTPLTSKCCSLYIYSTNISTE